MRVISLILESVTQCNITVFISFDRHEKSEMWDEKWEDWIKSVFNPSY